MQGLTYPSIELDHAEARLGRDTFRRGAEYVRQGRVVQCQWNPHAGKLVGTVRGNQARTYTTIALLVRRAGDTWAVGGGGCSCPMRVDCKHVAALVVAAEDRGNAARPVSWQQSLEALLPESSPVRCATSENGFLLPDIVRGCPSHGPATG